MRMLRATLLLCGILVWPGASRAGDVMAGVAAERLELPRGVPLAGYSRRGGRPSRGEHDPIHIRALVVQDADTTAALVSADLLIIDERLFESVREQLVAQGLPASLVLLLAATHTHSGPGAYGRRFLEKLSMGHFDGRVVTAIVQAVTRSIRLAYERRSPVRLAYGVGQAAELVTNRVEPSGPIDGDVVVVALYQPAAASPFAIVVGFAAHPTTLGAWNDQLSADYPGVIGRELARRVPGATVLFVAGAVGDQAPVKVGAGFERAEHLGLPLAERVAALLDGAEAAAPHAVHAVHEDLALPPARVRLSRGVTLPRWIGRRLVDDEAALSVVTVGPAAFIGVPCDLAASLGQRLKDAARARHFFPVIVGFANDYIGYCVPESLYRSDAYEALMAFNGPRAGELIVGRLVQMLEQVAHSTEETP
jgi:hypothetical protein